MAWGQWMIVEFSVEEELRIENQARVALSCDDTEQLAKLCSMLVKQNAYYSKLIAQATGHIGELEMILTFGNPRLQYESGDSDQIHPDDTQVRNPFAIALLIILGFVVDVAEFCFGLLQRVMPAKNPKNPG